MNSFALVICALAAVAVALPTDIHNVDSRWEEKKAESQLDPRVSEHVLNKLEQLDAKLNKLEAIAERLFGVSNANAVAIANANSFGGGFGGFGRRRRDITPKAEIELDQSVVDKLEELEEKLTKLEKIAERIGFGLGQANAVAIANANSQGFGFGRRRRDVSPMADAELDQRVIAKLEQLDAKINKLEKLIERIFGVSSANAVAIANANSFGGFGGFGRRRRDITPKVEAELDQSVVDKLEQLEEKLTKLEKIAERIGFGLGSANAVAIANANSQGFGFGR